MSALAFASLMQLRLGIGKDAQTVEIDDIYKPLVAGSVAARWAVGTDGSIPLFEEPHVVWTRPIIRDIETFFSWWEYAFKYSLNIDRFVDYPEFFLWATRLEMPHRPANDAAERRCVFDSPTKWKEQRLRELDTCDVDPNGHYLAQDFWMPPDNDDWRKMWEAEDALPKQVRFWKAGGQGMFHIVHKAIDMLRNRIHVDAALLMPDFTMDEAIYYARIGSLRECWSHANGQVYGLRKFAEWKPSSWVHVPHNYEWLGASHQRPWVLSEDHIRQRLSTFTNGYSDYLLKYLWSEDGNAASLPQCAIVGSAIAAAAIIHTPRHDLYDEVIRAGVSYAVPNEGKLLEMSLDEYGDSDIDIAVEATDEAAILEMAEYHLEALETCFHHRFEIHRVRDGCYNVEPLCRKATCVRQIGGSPHHTCKLRTVQVFGRAGKTIEAAVQNFHISAVRAFWCGELWCFPSFVITAFTGACVHPRLMYKQGEDAATYRARIIKKYRRRGFMFHDEDAPTTAAPAVRAALPVRTSDPDFTW